MFTYNFSFQGMLVQNQLMLKSLLSFFLFQKKKRGIEDFHFVKQKLCNLVIARGISLPFFFLSFFGSFSRPTSNVLLSLTMLWQHRI